MAADRAHVLKPEPVAATGGNELKHVGGFGFLLQRLLDRIDLTANAPDSVDQLFFVSLEVSHFAIDHT